MKNLLQYSLLALLAVGLMSCGRDKRSEGIEYAPQMYHSIPNEPYSQMNYFRPTNNSPKDGKHMREPVKGSIQYGKVDYVYPFQNTPEDYERAGKELKNPIPHTPENLETAKHLYAQYCQHCHGEKGDGEGLVIKSNKFPPPGAYNARLKDRTEGMIFHSITYGKNMMGSHASQLSPEERWKIVNYVRMMQGNLGEPTAAGAQAAVEAEVKADSTKKPEPAKPH